MFRVSMAFLCKGTVTKDLSPLVEMQFFSCFFPCFLLLFSSFCCFVVVVYFEWDCTILWKCSVLGWFCKYQAIKWNSTWILNLWTLLQCLVFCTKVDGDLTSVIYSVDLFYGWVMQLRLYLGHVFKPTVANCLLLCQFKKKNCIE